MRKEGSQWRIISGQVGCHSGQLELIPLGAAGRMYRSYLKGCLPQGVRKLEYSQIYMCYWVRGWSQGC